MSHHTHDPVCPSCTEKLQTAHPYLAEWFRKLKGRYLNAHVSWAYRGAEDQEQFFKEGKTHCHYPNSAHNKTKPDGTPCAMALDLFQLDDDGVARFAPLWYAKVNTENEANHEPIAWGGKFKSLGDGDHFELKPPSAPKPPA